MCSSSSSFVFYFFASFACVLPLPGVLALRVCFLAPRRIFCFKRTWSSAFAWLLNAGFLRDFFLCVARLESPVSGEDRNPRANLDNISPISRVGAAKLVTRRSVGLGHASTTRNTHIYIIHTVPVFIYFFVCFYPSR